MESNIEEALTAKAYAEKRFADRDFTGARTYAVKAQMLCPELEGIAQMVATFGVYTASEAKINGEFDFYAILGLDPSADKAKLKKQYRKMAVLLHPDKNKTVGADGAFKLVSEAWTILSDSVQRNSYDHRRNYYASHATGISGFDNYSKSSASHQRLDTFWTVCTSCHVQYEYLRKYVNKRLSCKNCRGVFIAVETGVAPVNGSFPYCPWSYVAENGYGSHGCGVAYVPSSSVYCSGNGISGHHSGHGSDYVSNLSFQWAYPGNSAGVSESNGLSMSTDVTHQVNGKTNRTKVNGKHHLKNAAADMSSNGYTGSEPLAPKASRPYKKRKVDLGSNSGTESVESAKTGAEVRTADGNANLKHTPKPLTPPENSVRRSSAAPAFDARQLLIDKARMVIRKKLEEFKLAAVTAAVKKKLPEAEADGLKGAPKRAGFGNAGHQSELKKVGSMSITVPDSDFHDFDKDRSEECFKPKQIWALYDEEDGMPRLYCLIRQVISVKPFKIYISYLSSKTDTEFGSVNWLDSGFTKSCGNFRVFNSEIVEQVNIFSHLLSREKAGRGGCVRIYPRSGDIWAVYRNWSPDWSRATPDELRHQYEMVEVLDDYSELGVCVAPLIKLDGFKTVYQRNGSKDAVRWIPRREMLRFSHQVPSCLLKGEGLNLPDGCWDLDPAAIPDELLQVATELQDEERPVQIENSVGISNDLCQAKSYKQTPESPSQTDNLNTKPGNCPQMVCEVRTKKSSQVESILLPSELQAETNVQA